jgi:hypothetical protein
LAAIYGRRLALEPALQANAALAALPEPDASAAPDDAPAADGEMEAFSPVDEDDFGHV